MLFNSLTFVVFFVIVVTLYWSIGSWTARKNLLVVASYIFYGAWNPPFAALLFSTTAMDFWLGRQIGKAKDRHKRRVWLVASVCMNLSMLGFFKYGNFLLQNFQWSAFRSTHSIHFLTRSTFIAAFCSPRDRCAILFSLFHFFRSLLPVQSCAPEIFSRNW